MLFILSLFFFTPSSFATLGEPIQSIEIDRGLLKAARPATTSSSSRFSVHEFESETGTVREYANSAGTVFGIAWSGTRAPDLENLLGTYAKDFAEAEAKKEREFGKRNTDVAGKSVRVQRWGHMRSLGGRAFDPALLPAGVTVDEIE